MWELDSGRQNCPGRQKASEGGEGTRKSGLSSRRRKVSDNVRGSPIGPKKKGRSRRAPSGGGWGTTHWHGGHPIN